MGYPIYHSQYTAAQIEASIGKTPRINSTNRTWEVWDIATSAYVDTGVSIDTDLFVDPTLTESGYAADAKATGDAVDNILQSITTGALCLQDYLYKRNTYINSSLVETPINGIDLYKIPVGVAEAVSFAWDGNNPFWIWSAGTFNVSYVARYVKTDDTYQSCEKNGSYVDYYWKPETDPRAFFSGFSGTRKAIVLAIPRETLNTVTVYRVSSDEDPGELFNVVNSNKTITVLSDANSVKAQFRLDPGNGKIAMFGSGYNSYIVRVRAGDKVVPSDISLTGLSYWGVIRYSAGSVSSLTSSSFTASGTGLLFCFVVDADNNTYKLYPQDSIMIDYQNVENVPTTENSYNGMDGVAFGTSLTFRSKPGQTGGYLSYLSTLSGITFDNQGLGSSTILAVSGQPEMLPVITGYNAFQGKRVCILEGFVNDWYYNHDKLGTWKDTGLTTVCGCVRYAINHIMTSNPNLTLFLILDHFGRSYNGVDSSSTALNSSGQTQYEWWAEIEKIALSMGVRVIREYEISEIGENTPQYLRDNIHCSMLGAEQSGKSIWSVMRQSYPNIIS